jgi:hypothetical protein
VLTCSAGLIIFFCGVFILTLLTRLLIYVIFKCWLVYSGLLSIFCYRIGFYAIMVFNTTFNNISVISRGSVLLVEETGVSGENDRPVASHWQPLSHTVVSNRVHLAMNGVQLTTSVVIGTDCTCSCKSNYLTITTTVTPDWYYMYPDCYFSCYIVLPLIVIGPIVSIGIVSGKGIDMIQVRKNTICYLRASEYHL